MHQILHKYFIQTSPYLSLNRRLWYQAPTVIPNEQSPFPHHQYYLGIETDYGIFASNLNVGKNDEF